ncbi:MAG: hypothetical protein GX778_02825 [Erysipelothrix sp.]|nr:hypothetical protein [Erysipelothrix sp.]
MKHNRVDKFLGALVFLGLVCVFFILFNYRYGEYGGLITASNIVILSFAYLTCDHRFFLGAGLGTMFGCLILNVSHYAIGCLIIYSLEYIILVFLLKKIKHPIGQKIIPFLVSVLFFSLSFVVVDWLITQNIEYLFISSLYNTFEGVVSAIVVMMCLPLFDFMKEQLPKYTEVANESK